MMDARKPILCYALGLIMALGVALPAEASRHRGDDPRFAECINKSADAFKISPAVIKVLIDVEGGEPGMEMKHPNGAVDLGVCSAKASLANSQEMAIWGKMAIISQPKTLA